MEAVVHYLLFTWGTDFLALFFDFSGGNYLCVSDFPLPFAVFPVLFFGARLASHREVRWSAGAPGGSDVFDGAGALAH